MELKCLFITSYISTIDFTIHNHHCSRIFFSPYIFNGQNQDWGWSDDVEPSLKLVYMQKVGGIILESTRYCGT